MDKTKETENAKLGQARQRVERIKGFYNHVGIFLVINVALLLSKDKVAYTLFGEVALKNPNITSWVYINILIWLVILLIHALLVFGKIPFFIKKWEQRKIQEFINKEAGREKSKWE